MASVVEVVGSSRFRGPVALDSDEKVAVWRSPFLLTDGEVVGIQRRSLRQAWPQSPLFEELVGFDVTLLAPNFTITTATRGSVESGRGRVDVRVSRKVVRHDFAETTPQQESRRAASLSVPAARSRIKSLSSGKMPRPRAEGNSKTTEPTIKEEPATPRRSKRKLDAENAELSPNPSKFYKTEVNGQVKGLATTPVKTASHISNELKSPSKSPKVSKTKKQTAKEIFQKIGEELNRVDGKKTRDSNPGKRRTKEADLEDSDIDIIDTQALGDAGEKPEKVKRKRKTKEEKEAEMLPLAARTQGLRMFVGAHVSMAGGLENSVKNSILIGGNAFALFLRSQKKWDNPPLKDETRDQFVALAKAKGYDQSRITLPHGSYLVNLAVEDTAKAKQSYDVFVDDLRRCEALGITLYNFHPGHFVQSTLEEGINRISQQLNKALAETKTVIPVLENAAGSGTVIGSRWSDLRQIIDGILPEYRDRVGVCIDTCHAFAAGYDLKDPRAFKEVLADFDKTVGMKHLKALHLNDSKAPIDCKKDLHQNIGHGFLGLQAFHNVMNEPRFEGMPLILETPCEVPDPNDKTGKKFKADLNIWAKEIKLLESLIGMDPQGPEFKALEAELSEKGRAEREKMQTSIETNSKKKEAKAKKALEKGQKTLANLFSGVAKTKSRTPKNTKGKSKKNEEDDSSDLSSLGSDSEAEK